MIKTLRLCHSDYLADIADNIEKNVKLFNSSDLKIRQKAVKYIADFCHARVLGDLGVWGVTFKINSVLDRN